MSFNSHIVTSTKTAFKFAVHSESKASQWCAYLNDSERRKAQRKNQVYSGIHMVILCSSNRTSSLRSRGAEILGNDRTEPDRDNTMRRTHSLMSSV